MVVERMGNWLRQSPIFPTTGGRTRKRRLELKLVQELERELVRDDIRDSIGQIGYSSVFALSQSQNQGCLENYQID